jgi:hypothetical protein
MNDFVRIHRSLPRITDPEGLVTSALFVVDQAAVANYHSELVIPRMDSAVTTVTASRDRCHSFHSTRALRLQSDRKYSETVFSRRLRERTAANSAVVEEVMMKRLLLMTLIVGATVASVSALASIAAAAPPGKDIEIANIPDKTKLLKVTLQGKYIFIHDDTRMAKGEPCLYVYEYSEDQAGQPEAKPERLVVSFHCQPVQREKATQIVLTYGVLSADLFELREIQFPGSAEGHRVP